MRSVFCQLCTHTFFVIFVTHVFQVYECTALRTAWTRHARWCGTSFPKDRRVRAGFLVLCISLFAASSYLVSECSARIRRSVCRLRPTRRTFR